MTVPTGSASGPAGGRSIPVTRTSVGAEFGSASAGVPSAPATAPGVQPTAPRVRTTERSPPAFGAPAVGTSAVGAEAPRIDLIETSDELLLIAELPGYDEDDILLEAIDQQIRIVAERDDDEVEDGYAHLRERLARVERTVPLPTPVDIEGADAAFEDGICRIEIPKIETSRAHRIGFH